LHPLQPRMSDALRPRLLGHQRNAEDLPAPLRPAARPDPRRRPDRPRVRGDLSSGRLSDDRGPDPVDAAARRAVHDGLPHRDPALLRRVAPPPGLAKPRRKRPPEARPDLWARHHAEWRDPAHIASAWSEAAETDPALLRHRVRGAFWETLAAAGITLLVTREYEHLVMALQARGGRPSASF